MKVMFQKPDLDTCLTALMMDVSSSDEVINLRSNAPENDIQNPFVLCIEAGGSGLVHLNNFDHHDPNRYYPPACLQAYEYKKMNDEKLARLVEYVCLVDDRPGEHPSIEFPSLSAIFSGMLLMEAEQLKQFYNGMEIFKKVLLNEVDPFSTMPDFPEWIDYKKAKEKNMHMVKNILGNTVFSNSKNGLKIGYTESQVIGGIGLLYRQGCDVVVMFNPSFGNPPIRKYTIASSKVGVAHLLKYFDTIEPGWGGRDKIIGSPRTGTTLTIQTVMTIIKEYL